MDSRSPIAPVAGSVPQVSGSVAPATAQVLRCRACGATDITFNPETKHLRCEFCGTEYEATAAECAVLTGTLADTKHLTGWTFSQGLANLPESADTTKSFACPSCQAVMAVGTETDVAAIRCHWCQHQLSVADQVSNGVRPDGLVPFSITRDDAHTRIAAYLAKRKFFAHPKFVKEFCLDNVRPVYLPYIIVDSNNHGKFDGLGAKNVREYTVKSGKNSETRYDYDVYRWAREFDFGVNDQLVEANQRYLALPGQKIPKDSRNIVNSILPFDVTGAVRYDPRYLNGGYRAEFRDVNFEHADPLVQQQLDGIGRHLCTSTLGDYKKTKFANTRRHVIGAAASTVLAPVWLYSYLDPKGRLHYICCNGQTGATAASVPVNKTKLLLVSGAIEIVAAPIGIALIALGLMVA